MAQNGNRLLYRGRNNENNKNSLNGIKYERNPKAAPPQQQQQQQRQQEYRYHHQHHHQQQQQQRTPQRQKDGGSFTNDIIDEDCNNRTPNGKLIHSINSITPYKRDWTIKGKVTQMDQLRFYATKSNADGKRFSFALSDGTDEIFCICFGVIAESLSQILVLNKTYFFSKGKGKVQEKSKTFKQFPIVDGKYQIVFQDGVDLYECTESNTFDSFTETEHHTVDRFGGRQLYDEFEKDLAHLHADSTSNTQQSVKRQLHNEFEIDFANFGIGDDLAQDMANLDIGKKPLSSTFTKESFPSLMDNDSFQNLPFHKQWLHVLHLQNDEEIPLPIYGNDNELIKDFLNEEYSYEATVVDQNSSIVEMGNPIKSSKNCRAYRKYGQHRFLRVNIPKEKCNFRKHQTLTLPFPGFRTYQFFQGEEVVKKSKDNRDQDLAYYSCDYFAIDGLGMKPKEDYTFSEYLHYSYYDNIQELQCLMNDNDYHDNDNSNTIFDCYRERDSLLKKVNSYLVIPKVSLFDFIDWQIPLAENLTMDTNKLLTRMSLSFTDTIGTCKVTYNKGMYEELVSARIEPDIENEATKECLTDGCGLMSLEVRNSIHNELQAKKPKRFLDRPCWYQMRVGPAKGLLLLDKQLSGKKIILRDSMIKYNNERQKVEFDRPHHTIEVKINSGRPKPGYLNSQFIQVLEAAKVRPTTFVNLLDIHIEKAKSQLFSDDTEEILKALNIYSFDLNNEDGDDEEIIESADSHDLRTSDDEFYSNTKTKARSLVCAGFEYDKLPYLYDLLTKIFYKEIESLHKKYRIKVEESVKVPMVPDPTGTLQEGEMYLRLENFDIGSRIDLFGLNLVCLRNPCYLASDVQKYKNVNYLELHHLSNVCVFPASSKLEYSQASLLSGGDYDGDYVFVTWNQDICAELQPKKKDHQEFDRYTEELFDVKKNSLDSYLQGAKRGGHPHLSDPKSSLMESLNIESLVWKLFTEHQEKETQLGLISHYHKCVADKKGSESVEAKKLSVLFNGVIDMPKNGLFLSKKGEDVLKSIKVGKPDWDSYDRDMSKYNRECQNSNTGANKQNNNSNSVINVYNNNNNKNYKINKNMNNNNNNVKYNQTEEECDSSCYSSWSTSYDSSYTDPGSMGTDTLHDFDSRNQSISTKEGINTAGTPHHHAYPTIRSTPSSKKNCGARDSALTCLHKHLCSIERTGLANFTERTLGDDNDEDLIEPVRHYELLNKTNAPSRFAEECLNKYNSRWIDNKNGKKRLKTKDIIKMSQEDLFGSIPGRQEDPMVLASAAYLVTVRRGATKTFCWNVCLDHLMRLKADAIERRRKGKHAIAQTMTKKNFRRCC